MTRAREWQVSLDFKARLDEDAAFDLMEALGRYGASVAVDPGHTGGGLTLAVDAPLVTLETDKATLDVPAEQAGRVIEVRVKAGDSVQADEVVVEFE